MSLPNMMMGQDYWADDGTRLLGWTRQDLLDGTRRGYQDGMRCTMAWQDKVDGKKTKKNDPICEITGRHA